MSISAGTPVEAGARDQINQRLLDLWRQTNDPTVLEYVTSNWTTPVSPLVQRAVSAIVGREVPTVGSAVVQAGGPTAPPAGAPPGSVLGQGFGAGARQASAPFYNATSAPNPQAPEQGRGSDATPRSAPVTTPAGVAGLGTPQLPGGGPGGAPVTTPAGVAGLGTPQVVPQPGGPSGYAPPVNPAGDLSSPTAPAAGGQPVSATPFAPNAQNPLIDPAVGSGVNQMGYGAALNEDPGAQAAVLSKILGDLGVNVLRPGLYTGNFLKTIQPYFQTFLRYYGLQNDGPVRADQAQAIAERFRGMLGTPGTFGQIQDFGRSTLAGLPGLLEGIGGRPDGVERQIDITKDIMGLLMAGNNPIAQEAQQGRQRQNELLFRIAGLDPANANMQWPEFIRQQATTGQLPGGDLLAQILGIT